MYRGNRWQLAADYNAWMNARLYAVYAALSDEDRGSDVFADFDGLRVARATLDVEIGEWAAGLTDEWLNAPYTFVSKILQGTRVQQ